MAFLEGTVAYNVGVQQIDDDHIAIVKIANELDKAIAGGIERSQLIPILDRLIAVTTQHFKHEGDAFDKAGYPNAATHKGQHSVAVAMAKQFRHELLHAGTSHHTLELLALIKGWFLLHVEHEDKDFGAFLKSRKIR